MPGPEEWRPRRGASQGAGAAQNPAYRLASHFRCRARLERTEHRMNPDAERSGRRRAGRSPCCSPASACSGPFSIDTYLPAFTGIAQAIGASPVEMQQTLSAYLFGFAVMNLFHGALSDSFGSDAGGAGRPGRVHARIGRLRPVAAHRRAGLLPRPPGHVGGRRHRRSRAPSSATCFLPADAQRVMSQVTIYFGVAPAVAPMVGGFLFVHAGWHSIFWFLTGIGVVLFAVVWRLLPETLHDTHRQPFNVRNLLRRLLGARRQSALLHARAGERHPVQRHVPLRAVDAGLPRREPAASAPGAVLLVLRADDRRDHGRRVPVRADGGQGQDLASDPLRLRHHGLGLDRQPGAQPAVRGRRPGGRCCRSRSMPSAGR